MKSTLIFIVGLVVLAQATQDVQVFSQIDQHPFGSTLLDFVQFNMQANAQTEMKSEDSLNQISNALNQINADMKLAKKTGDQEYKAYQQTADNDIAAFKKVLEEQRNRKVETQKQLDADRILLKNTQDDLASAQAHLKNVNEQIQNADQENVRAIAAQAKKSKELKEAVAACKEATVELNKLTTGAFIEGAQVNMLQVKSGMQKVEQALQNHLPSRMTMFKPIIMALVDMSTNADPALVKKVMGLVAELQTNLETELANSIKQEATRIADYNKLRADLVNDQQNTQQRIGRNQSLIKSLLKKNKQNEDIIAKLTITIANNEQLLKVREQEKKDNHEAYVKANAQRVEELQVIDQLIKYFETKFQKSMSTYLRNRVAKF